MRDGNHRVSSREATRTRPWGVAWLGACVFVVVGCAGAPVQEMSDARQAIQSAEDAGAREYSPDRLNAAERLLRDAREELASGAYGDARRAARAAWSEAVEARKAAMRKTHVEQP